MSVTMKVFQLTKETPIKPSLTILTNAKDNEIIDHYTRVRYLPCQIMVIIPLSSE